LAANQLIRAFEFARRIIDQSVEWITANEVWLSNVLPDSMVIIIFAALAAYFATQLQYPI